jgi:alpha-aminoadipate carrier protein LysW
VAWEDPVDSKNQQRAECPECGATVLLKSPPRMGQRVTCHECDEELEVVGLNPMELDYAPGESDDDWDDDDWPPDEDDDADSESWWAGWALL